MVYPQLKESADSERIKRALFEHCAVAADKAIDAPSVKAFNDRSRLVAAAKHSALLSVITEAGLADEYRQYRERSREYGKRSPD